MSKYDELVKQRNELKDRAVRIEVWLKNYEAEEKVVQQRSSGGTAEVAPVEAFGRSFAPVITLSNRSDWIFGHVILTAETSPILFTEIYRLARKLLGEVQAELAAVTAKIEAVEELLRG